MEGEGIKYEFSAKVYQYSSSPEMRNLLSRGAQLAEMNFKLAPITISYNRPSLEKPHVLQIYLIHRTYTFL